MPLYAVGAFCAAAMAIAVACLQYFRRQAGPSRQSLVGLLMTVAVDSVASALGALLENDAVFWRGIALSAEVLQPAALLYVGLAFVNPIDGIRDSAALWRARIAGCVGLLLAVSAVSGYAYELKDYHGGHPIIAVTSWGRVHYVFIAVGMTLGLAKLELVLRASREPARHRLKFILIGLGGLAGYQIYQASQMLLLPVWRSEYVLISSVITIMALSLVVYGLFRARLQEILVNAYISPQALFGTLTFVLIGLYLLILGIVGEWLRRTNHPLSLGLSIVLMFGAVVALFIAAFSKTVRAEIRRFLFRNFYRSKYDYRAQWLHVTESFQEVTGKEAIMDRLLDLLIKTFPTTSLSIWSFREADRRFIRSRWMVLEQEPAPIELSHPVVKQLLERDEAVFLETKAGKSGDGFADGEPLTGSGAVMCFPIKAQGKLMAFVAMGRQLHGEPYRTDDCDLLRGILHHVGALLTQAHLAEERRASAELEALHRFSVFCLHDLKNLAARLSLVAQNAEHHGRDPAFQASATKTVTDTANKMTALMSKLSLSSFRPMLAGKPEPVEIAALIDDVVAPLRGDHAVQVQVTGGPVQPVTVIKDQIHQVLLNVVLNARQAIIGNGTITITMGESGHFLVITVDDSGKGIPAAMLESLFMPSQSGRAGGLGVGLYQCKQIVEAHQGTIRVRSEVGTGTQVRIELPSSPGPGGRGASGLGR